MGIVSRRRSTPRSKHNRRDDAGFLLVEAVVAMGVLTVIVLATELGLTETFSAATIAKEQEIASSLATTTIAEATALPFSDLKSGLNPSADSLSVDSNITATVSGGVTTYTLNLNGATIAATNTNTSEAPLVPHTATVTDGVTYTVSCYPTVSASATDLVTLVVIVTWNAPPAGQQRFVAESSISAP